MVAVSYYDKKLTWPPPEGRGLILLLLPVLTALMWFVVIFTDSEVAVSKGYVSLSVEGL